MKSPPPGKPSSAVLKPPRKIAIMIGTRPEAIKLMPVVRSLEAAGSTPEILITGQHRELLDPILKELGLSVTENLRVMTTDQTLGTLSARLIERSTEFLRRRHPDLVVVQGDTNSAAMSALAAFYEGIPVAHVEAGLRTHVRDNPFPEEMNRRLLACLGSLHFAPTRRARDHLLGEGVHPQSVHLVGNTAIDALVIARHRLCQLPEEDGTEPFSSSGRRLVLITLHRRESVEADLAATCEGIARLAASFGDSVDFVLPVHRNPGVRREIEGRLARTRSVRLIEPVSYFPFVRAMLRAHLIITDSGGIQEEAAFLGIPTLVTRRVSERPEAIEAGVAELVGPDPVALFEATKRLLTDPSAYRSRAISTNAFGDGRAARRIVDQLLQRPS